MIQAVIFDLGGTLVQTEKLKAMSYARVVAKLCRRCVNEREVVEAFKEVVGRSRQEVSLFLMERFALEEAARSRMEEFGVKAAWQAFAQVRLQIYEGIVADPEVLLNHQWPHNIALLKQVRNSQLRVGLGIVWLSKTRRRVSRPRRRQVWR